MFRSIPRDQYRTLILRVIVGLFNMYCAYHAIKYFPIVFVSLILNLAPLLVVLFSYILYREMISRFDTMVLFASFIGVCVLITGSFEEHEENEKSYAY